MILKDFGVYLYRLLSRVQNVLPFIISLLVLLFVHRYWGNSSLTLIMERSGMVSLSTIVLLSAVLSLFSYRVCRYTQYFLLGGAFLLDSTEIFLATHFNMSISPQVFQLLAETNSQEASEFMQTYVFSFKTGWILLTYLLVLCLVVSFYVLDSRWKKWVFSSGKQKCIILLWGGLLFFSLIFQGSMFTYYARLARVFSAENMRQMERFVNTELNGNWIAYYPFWRLVYSVKVISIAGQENNIVWQMNQNLTCRLHNRKSSPLICVVLGESYVKRHSQLYGYLLPTSPYMNREKEAGRLFVFQDAITLKNMTSIAFKSFLSLNKSASTSWNEVPLFPAVLRAGHYKTCFYSNQFVPKNGDIWTTVGGHFLSTPQISQLLFDERNTQSYTYDGQMLPMVEQVVAGTSTNLFVLFHGVGQHVNFSLRCPKDDTYFTPSHYVHRTELSEQEKQLVADYDNATRYVDKVMYQLMCTLKDKDAILVYISDHGEEVLDETHKLGRQHNLSQDVIRSEYEIPMWIWCSDTYQINHPEVTSQIKQAVNKPFTIDDMSHLIIGLSGIQCDYYDPTRDLLSPSYEVPVKRGIGFDGFRFGGYYEDMIKGASDNLLSQQRHIQ